MAPRNAPRYKKKKTKPKKEYAKTASLNHVLRKDLVWVLSNQLTDRSNDLLDGLGRRAVGKIVHEALTIVTRHANSRVQGNSPQERNAHLLGQSSPTAGRSSEDLRLVGALRTDETRHVLYQAQDTNTRFAAEVDFFADVQQRHLLRVVTTTAPSTADSLRSELTDRCSSDVPGGVSTTR